MFVLPSFILSLMLFPYIGLSSAAHAFFHLSEEFILIILTSRSTGDISSIFVDMIRCLPLNLKDVLLDTEFYVGGFFFLFLLTLEIFPCTLPCCVVSEDKYEWPYFYFWLQVS